MKTYLFPSALLALSLLLPATASAQTFEFDPLCAPESVFNTQNTTPSVLIVLDKSGSMGSNNKWNLAKAAITDVANSTNRSGPCNMMDSSGCDEIQLGLGWFSSGGGTPVNPAEDTNTTITTWLGNNSPGGGTATNEAAQQIYNNATLADPTGVGIGVIITDGVPNSSAVEPAIAYLCEARKRGTGPVPTFMVGFGAGSNQDMNSFMAAAGGTGECCQGSSCTYQPSEIVDPCDLGTLGNVGSYDVSSMASGNTLNSGYKCRGSLEASNAQALKDALLDIAAQAACTFPLDIPANYPAGAGADPDPAATRVIMNHSILGTGIRVSPLDMGNPNLFRDALVNQYAVAPALADQYIGEGWFFGNAVRTNVTMSPKLCQDIRNDTLEVTKTQVACLCNLTDQNCDMPGQTGRCKPGFYKCVVCRPGVAGCSGKPDGPTDICTPIYTAQPEICNGIDDNCDGTADNLDSSEPGQMPPGAYEWNMSTMPVPSDKAGLFCSYQNSCSCGLNSPNTPDPDYRPSPFDDEWQMMIDAWDGSCLCSEGLSPTSTDENSLNPGGEEMHLDDSDSSAACSTSSINVKHSPVLLGILFGLFWRRRKR